MKMGSVHRYFNGAIFLLLHFYKSTFSVLLGPCCRFTPSCSSYALSSIQRFGIVDGAKLAMKRLIKCHPFNPGGYDPVPENPTIHSPMDLNS